MAILKLDNVAYRYKDAPKDKYVFKEINYEFEQGKMYAIKGKSGSGKTTLLSLITGLEKCTEGRVLYNDEDLKKMNLDKETENEILKIFKNLAKNENKCVIIVTHSQNVCNECDVIYELK